MDDHQEFKNQCSIEINEQGESKALKELTSKWFEEASKTKYSYHFEWLGIPIIQFPQDIVGAQQLIWNVKPDLIIETGIARGGSLIFYASILELISQCGGPQNAKVVGIDIDIRHHNKSRIAAHPMYKRIEMIEGSSISDEVIEEVKKKVEGRKKIMVCLDSNHSHSHVLRELQLYAPLVSKGSYCLVFDTVIENMPENSFKERNWGKGNNAKTAVHQFLGEIEKNQIKGIDGSQIIFKIDKEIENQLVITVSPDGFLKRI